MWEFFSPKSEEQFSTFYFLREKSKIVFWLLIALLGIFFLATIFSLDRNFSLWGSPYRSGGFLNFAFYIIFAILAFLILRKEDWQKIWDFVIGIGILVSTVAIFQQFGIFSDILIPTATKLPSTVGGPIFLGIYLLLLSFLTLSFGLREKSLKKKIFYFISFLVFIFVILLTISQAAYLGFAFGFLYFLFFYPKKIVLFKILIGFLIILGLFGVYFLKTHPEVSLNQNYIIQNLFQWRIDLSRISSWKVSFGALKDRPVLGYGPENFSIGFDKYYDPSLPGIAHQPGGYTTSWWDRAHNFVFEISLTAGIPALIIYLALFGILFWQLQRLKKDYNPPTTSSRRAGPSEKALICHGIQATFLAYFVANFFSFDRFSSYLISFLLISYSLYLISNADSQAKNLRRTVLRRLQKYRGAIIFGLFILLIWFIWIFNIKPFQINKEIRVAHYQAKNGDYQGALARMENLLSSHTFLDNHLRLHYIDIINEYLAKSPEPIQEILAQKAIQALKENVKIRPLYTRNWLLLGNYTNVLIEKGQKDLKEEANYYFEKANELSPKRQEVFLGWLKTDFLTGNYSGAEEKAQKCIDLNEKLRDCWWLMGLSKAYLKDFEKSDSYIKTAQEKGYNIQSEKSWLELTKAYVAVENYQGLVETYSKLISINPRHPQYHASLAYVYKELGEKDLAKKEALKVLELDPATKTEVEEFLKTLE